MALCPSPGLGSRLTPCADPRPRATCGDDSGERRAGAPGPRRREDHDLVIVRREAGLVRLAAPHQPVPGHTVRQRLADRMKQDDEPDRAVVEGRVATALVEGLDVADPEAVDRGARLAVDLEKPEAESSALERAGREVAVERLALFEVRLRP